MCSKDARRDVHLFVLDTFADFEPSYAVAHINRPAPGVPARYRVRSVSLERAPVRSVAGLTIVPDLAIDDLDPKQSAMLILPGADVWDDTKYDAALDKAREFVKAGVPVAAICGATHALARAGLLDDRRHTSNDARFLATSGYAGERYYVNEAAVEDRGVITASSMAALEFARLILARLEVFPKAALDAWYGLYTTRDPAWFYAFIEALGQPAPAQPGP